MQKYVSPDEIATAVRAATQEVFATMLNLPVETGTAYQEQSGSSHFDGVVALVGVAGLWTGSGRIWCSPRCACRISSALLMTEYENVNEEVLDAVAEVANMIIGNVKTYFEETLGPLGLSVPTVIFGRNYQARSMGITEWTVVPFLSRDERIEIRFTLVETQRTPLAHHRPEAVLAAD